MIKFKNFLNLALTVALLTSNLGYSATNPFLEPRDYTYTDIKFSENLNTFSSSEILRRMSIVDPELKLEQLKIEKQKAQLDLQPERKPSVLNFSPWWIATNMILAQIDDLTFRRVEKAALKNVNVIYVALAQKDLDIKIRYRQIDFQKLCIKRIVNQKKRELLQQNINYFSVNEELINDLYENHQIITSDKLYLESISTLLNNELDSLNLEQKSIDLGLGKIIGTTNFKISGPDNILLDKYQIPNQKLNKNPFYKKLELLVGLTRSQALLQKVASRPDFANYLSITIRRIIFEGWLQIIQQPTEFFTIFQNPNTKVYRKMYQYDIQIANQELQVLKKNYEIQFKSQIALISKKYATLKEKDILKQYYQQKLYEQQELFKNGLTDYQTLVRTTQNLYLAELSYLEALEDYNLTIIDLNYYTGDFNA